MKFGLKRTNFVVFAVASVCVLAAALANGQGAQQQRPRLAGEIFKAVPALKDIPVDEFMDTMGMFSAATSMNCTDCHTEDSGSNWENYAKETPLKQTARRMILMTNALNRNNFRNERRVTCYTCHRGDQTPKAVPSLTVQYGVPFEDPNEIDIYPDPQAPPADQIIDRYIEAIGGAQRVSALTSFSAKGTYEGFDTEQAKVPIEIYAQAAGPRTTIVHTPFGDSTRTYDGRNAWIAAADKPMPLMPLSGGNLDGARIDAVLSFPARIKQVFTRWRVGITTIDDKEVRIIQAIREGQTPVNLYFDETGLMVRAVRYTVTAVGTVPTQIDFSEYREVAGVRMPFKWTTTWTNGQSTTELTEILPNVQIEAGRFAQPRPAVLPTR
jgi:hypothetical protein